MMKGSDQRNAVSVNTWEGYDNPKPKLFGTERKAYVNNQSANHDSRCVRG